MAGTVDPGGVIPLAHGSPGGRFSYHEAGRENEAELRELLRNAPLPGWIRLAYEREPDFFLAATIEGETSRTIVVRERSTGRVAALFTRTERLAFLNGAPAPLGYLSQLRVTPPFLGDGALVKGCFRYGYAQLHPQGGAPFYLTSILERNQRARRLLEAGLPGFPTYRFFTRFITVAIPCHPGRCPVQGVILQRGEASRLEEIAQWLQQCHGARQGAPLWTAEALADPHRCRGLRAEDFFLARDTSGRLVGCLALWDQRGFKQWRVHGYAQPWGWVRPALNGLARLTGYPRLPAPGRVLEQAFLSHVAVAGDDEAIFSCLVQAAMNEAARREIRVLVMGFAEGHPLLDVLMRRYRAMRYISRLYWVHWPDGEAAVQRLDGRPPHVEAAVL